MENLEIVIGEKNVYIRRKYIRKKCIDGVEILKRKGEMGWDCLEIVNLIWYMLSLMIIFCLVEYWWL